MVTVKVTAPVGGYSGRVGNDTFVDGVAEVEKSGVDYYLRHGYLVEGVDSENVKTQTVLSVERVANEAGIIGEKVRPAPGDRKAAWVAYAESLGIDTVGKTKEDLMEESAVRSVGGRNAQDV